MICPASGEATRATRPMAMLRLAKYLPRFALGTRSATREVQDALAKLPARIRNAFSAMMRKTSEAPDGTSKGESARSGRKSLPTAPPLTSTNGFRALQPRPHDGAGQEAGDAQKAGRGSQETYAPRRCPGGKGKQRDVVSGKAFLGLAEYAVQPEPFQSRQTAQPQRPACALDVR